MLATAVLLAACVHDTEELILLPTTTGASLVYLLGDAWGGKSGEEDDPWDTIREKFDADMVHVRKGGADGPEDPWDTIQESFGIETVHTGKREESFRGYPASGVVFVSFLPPAPGWREPDLELVEVRDGIGRFCTLGAGGEELFAVGLPASWEAGMVLAVKGYWLKDSEALPLVGVLNWEVLPLRVDAPIKPSVRVIPDTVAGQLVWPDPWNQIQEEGF